MNYPCAKCGGETAEIFHMFNFQERACPACRILFVRPWAPPPHPLSEQPVEIVAAEQEKT
jgi:DNA-directed RNA polymerase subunit RPC12/RpoP